MAKRKRKKNVVLAPASEPPIRPGIIGLSRTVPADIVKPPYAETGDPECVGFSVRPCFSGLQRVDPE